MYEKFCLNLVSEREADIVIFGALLGKNSKKMLNSLRKASWFVEWFDLERRENLVEKVKVVDIGNVKASEIEKMIQKILKDKKIPFMISQSHLATYFALKCFNNEIKVISFDAHFDLKNNYIDEKVVKSIYPLKIENIKEFNCSTWARRSFEEGKKNFCFVGVRSCDEFELEFVERNKLLFFTPTMINKNLEFVERKLKEFVENSNVYLTVDVDVFDPSIAPGVEHPEPEGVFLHQFTRLIQPLKRRIIGVDLTEIKPMTNSEVTEFLANKAMFEILSTIK